MSYHPKTSKNVAEKWCWGRCKIEIWGSTSTRAACVPFRQAWVLQILRSLGEVCPEPIVYPTTWVLPLWMAEPIDGCSWGVSQPVSMVIYITGFWAPPWRDLIEFFPQNQSMRLESSAYLIEELRKDWHEFRLCLRKQNGLLLSGWLKKNVSCLERYIVITKTNYK